MANVLFKRGLQSNLPVTHQDGTFYLTTDTHRLYVDNASDRFLLNQTVQIVANEAALQAKAQSWTTNAEKQAHVNDFYYLQTENILAVWINSGSEQSPYYEWKQINPDTDHIVDDVTLSATVDNNVATITSIVQASTGGGDTASATATMTMSAGSGITLGSDGNGNLTINGRTYNLGASLSASNDVIAIELSNSDTATPSVVNLQAGNAISFSTTNNNFVISSVNTIVATGSMTSSGAGNLQFSVFDSDGNDGSGQIDGLGIALHDGGVAFLTANNTGTAKAIYSADEIDNKLGALDGMHFIGSVGQGGTVNTLPTTNVEVGDVYVANSDTINLSGVTFNGSSPGTSVRAGDMFIATGTEGNDGKISSGLAWVYIPSGNDSIDAFSYVPIVTTATNTVLLQNVLSEPIAGISLIAGTDMAIASTATVAAGSTTAHALNATINHATISTTTSSTTSNGASSFQAIKDVTVSNGHITAINYDTFIPVTYDISSITATSVTAPTTANPASSVNVSFATLDSAGNAGTPQNINLYSNTIALSPGAAQGSVQMDLVWGEF